MADGMTAKISAFARAWHARRHGSDALFSDTLARDMLGEADYEAAKDSLAKGIGFFAPGFSGDADAALDKIVDGVLGPTPLARARWTEEGLRRAAARGVTQYVLLGAGLDTFAWRREEWARGLRVYEVDLPAASRDKRMRVGRAGLPVPENFCFVEADLSRADWTDALVRADGYDPRALTYCAMSGLTYYLDEDALGRLFGGLAKCTGFGSDAAFDFPMRLDGGMDAQARLAGAAGEGMRAGYTQEEIIALLEKEGFLAYEMLTDADVDARYFAERRPMRAQKDAGFCLASNRNGR